MTFEFLEEVRTFAFTARTKSQLGFDPARAGRSPSKARRAGMFWASPVFRVGSSGLELGVRWLPGAKSVLDLPMNLIQEDRAQTLATTLREGLSLAIIDLAIGSQRGKNWKILSERRAEAEPQMAAFEALLGGSSISRLFDVLEDNDLGDRLAAEGEVRFDAYVELIERLDPEQGRARRYIHSLGGSTPSDRPTSAPWEQVMATAEFKRAQRDDDRFDLVAASWALFAAPVSLDAAIRGTVRQPQSMRWRGGRWTVMYAAKALKEQAGEVPEELRTDPLWPAVMSLADTGEACDGLAFVEAAAHLDESDQPERAVAALAAAAYLS